MKMRRDFIVYVGLLVVSLGAAYYVSLPQDKASESQVSWINIEPERITELRYSSEKSKTVLVRKDGGFWASVTEPDPKKNDESSKTEFKVNSDVEAMLEGFNPFYAKRSLGEIADDKLADFELKDTNRLVEVVAKGEVLFSIKLGKRAYGSRNLYVLDTKKNEVLLVSGQLTEPLEKAKSKLFEKKYFDSSMEEITGAVITSGGSSLAIDHTKRDGSGSLVWTDKEGDGTPVASYKNLMAKLEKLRIQRYAVAEEIPMLTGGEAFATIVLMKKESKLVELKFLKAMIPGEEKTSYWIDSSFLGGIAKFSSSRGEPLEKDIPTLFKDK